MKNRVLTNRVLTNRGLTNRVLARKDGIVATVLGSGNSPRAEP
ncbi:MAG TPA: hypothetical protein VFD71_07890 [Planctomycetota bacterium]|nr:hypothetical protein [Planctomycetota bacterium]